MPLYNLCFEIDWTSLIVGSKFTVFALFYSVFEGNFPGTSPPGGLYQEGRFNGGFFVLQVWGAFIWRGLFSEFYGITYIHDMHFKQQHDKTLKYFKSIQGSPSYIFSSFFCWYGCLIASKGNAVIWYVIFSSLHTILRLKPRRDKHPE